MVNGERSGSDILVIRVGCRTTTCGVLAATSSSLCGFRNKRIATLHKYIPTPQIRCQAKGRKGFFTVIHFSFFFLTSQTTVSILINLFFS